MKAFATLLSLAAASSATDVDPVNSCEVKFYVPNNNQGQISTHGTGTHSLVSIGGGQTANMMPGWIDPETSDSRFFDIPESQMLNYAYIPPWNIQSGSYMRFWCAKHSSIQKCDIYLNVYRCSDCDDDLNADFSDYLISEQWTPSKCGPKFFSAPGQDHHKFHTYRKQVPSDHVEYVYFDSNVKLMFATMDSNGVDCSDYALSKCETSGYQQCKVINGQCVDNWCPKSFQGPLPGCPAPPCVGCNNCALKEPAFQ